MSAHLCQAGCALPILNISDSDMTGHVTWDERRRVSEKRLTPTQHTAHTSSMKPAFARLCMLAAGAVDLVGRRVRDGLEGRRHFAYQRCLTESACELACATMDSPLPSLALALDLSCPGTRRAWPPHG